MTAFGVLSLCLGTAGFIAVIVQIQIAIRAFKADHERRRKQATIEYGGKIWAESRYQLESKYGTRPLTDEQLAQIEDDPEQDATIRRLLGNLEYMAVGVNTGIYSKDILYRMSATSLITMFRRLEKYIKAKRAINPTLYIELQGVVDDFEARKKNDLSAGNIRYS